MHFKGRKLIIVSVLSVMWTVLQAQTPVEVQNKNPKPQEKKKETPADSKGKSITLPRITKEKGTIFFENTHANLNIVKEESGINYTTFSFANIGKGDLVVMDVHASCGCTTPVWSKDVIKPNQTGYIKVGFSPTGQAGHFSKTLTVTTNGDPATVYLDISGEVTGTTKEWHTMTPVSQGNMRSTANMVTMRKVTDAARDSVLFNFYNSSPRDIEITEITVPKYITTRVLRTILPAGTGTNMYFIYNPQKGARYGPNEEEILIATTDDSMPVKRYMLHMNMEEDFSKVPEEIRKKPPVVKFTETAKDFGEIYLSEVVTHDFEVTNKGKSDLVIRRAYGNCGCTVAGIPSEPIKKGKTGKITVSVNAKNLYGPIDKLVTVITNDPKHPVTVLNIKANVVDPGRK